MPKKVKDIKVNEEEIIQKFKSLTPADQKSVNYFLMLRELTYSEYQKVSEDGQKYIDMLFPSAVSK